MKALFIRQAKLFFSLLIAMQFLAVQSNSQNIPTGQSLGSLERTTETEKVKKSITTKLKKEKEDAPIEGEEKIIPKEAADDKEYPEETVLISDIVISGVTILKPKVIQDIRDKYVGKELTLGDFATIAEEITDEYRSRGYVTSIAYLPPQRIENNTLVMEVIEGKIGNISVEGNKFFSTRQLEKYLDMRKDEIFNYDELRKNLNYVNEHPDRNASVVLVKGEEQGQTDIDVQVEDRLPVHATFGYNNHNSEYLGENKFQAELKATNLWGLDHIASGEIQFGEEGKFMLYSGRYLMPITSDLQFGASYIRIEQKLGKEVKALDIRGRGDVVSAFFNYSLISNDVFSLNISPGFEYKDIENKLLGIVISEDNTRVAKIGLDADYSDNFGGRTIVTQSFDFGIPDFLGGLGKKDSKSSRVGAGGNFFRSVTNAAHIQTLPFSTSLMLRGAAQFSSDPLVSSEQFNIGGVNTVRGYSVSEYTGDHGYTSTAELYIPPMLKVKFSTLKTFFR